MTYTIGKLAKKFGLSRSALLYYDSIGLLRPTGHVAGEYRSYSEEDAARLSRICLYRRVGLPLAEIKTALDEPDSGLSGILEARLDELNRDMAALRGQQRLIVGLLKNRGAMHDAEARIGFMNRETWVRLLESAGFDQLDQMRWHMAFERHNPEKHREFLEFLCIPDDEAARIRALDESDLESRRQRLENERERGDG